MYEHYQSTASAELLAQVWRQRETTVEWESLFECVRAQHISCPLNSSLLLAPYIKHHYQTSRNSSPFPATSSLFFSHKRGMCFAASNLEASVWLAEVHSHDVLNMARKIVKNHSFQSQQCLDLGDQVRGITVQHHSKHRTKAEDTECLTEKGHDKIRCTRQYIDNVPSTG